MIAKKIRTQEQASRILSNFAQPTLLKFDKKTKLLPEDLLIAQHIDKSVMDKIIDDMNLYFIDEGAVFKRLNFMIFKDHTVIR